MSGFPTVADYWFTPVQHPLESTSSGFLAREDPPAVTPYKVICQSGKLSLRYYQAVGRPHTVPLLFVYALIKRPFILDLQRGISVIENLTRQGFEVFLVDWLPPTTADSWRGFDAYVNQDLSQAVNAVRLHQRVEQVPIVGYCLGGLLSLLYTALHPKDVKALVTLTTPFDTSIRDFSAYRLFDCVDRQTLNFFIALYGDCPAWLLRSFFSAMAPMHWILCNWFGLPEANERDRYAKSFPALRLWLEREVPITGALFRELVLDIFKQNLLARGAFRVGDKVVDLKRIECPLLNVVAEFDSIVPPSSSLPLIDFVASCHRNSLRFPTGHLGAAIDAEAHVKLWPQIGRWLEQHCN